MPQVPVTYLCWGCGSEKTILEEVEEDIPALTVWNICLECIEKKGSNEGLPECGIIE